MSESNDADDDCGYDNDGCGDGPSCSAAAAAVAVGRFALVKLQQSSRCAAGSAGASSADGIASAAAASCNEMADVGASFDSAALGCEEIECSRRCR